MITSAIGVLALASCNTVKGVGQDVESAGRGIEHAAQRTSDAL